MHGLSGDFTPPSRLVRAVAFTQAALPAETAPQAVLEAFHILNAFDIRFGAVRADLASGGVDYTLWTSVADLKNLKWYFRTYDGQSIRAVDFPEAIAAAKGKTKAIKMDSKQPVEDISTKPNKHPHFAPVRLKRNCRMLESAFAWRPCLVRA